MKPCMYIIIYTVLCVLCLAIGFQTSHKVIAKSYITSIGFILDVLAILPLEVFAFTMPDHGLDWAITLKINRLIKLWKVHVHCN